METKTNKLSASTVLPSFEVRVRIGFLAVANAGIIENDMFSMCPDNINLHFTRIPMNKKININNLTSMVDKIGDGVQSIMPGREDLDIICYNCTSASFIIGEDVIVEEIKKSRKDVIATTMLSGVVAALEVLQVKNIAIGTAYTEDINAIERQYFEGKGYNITKMAGLNIETDIDMNEVDFEQIIELAVSVDTPDADVVFLSCGALRSTELIEHIENIIKKPVITSNQASFWNCLRLVGINDKFSGYGRLLEYY